MCESECNRNARRHKKKCSKPRTKSPNKVQKCYEKCVSGLGIGRQERQGRHCSREQGRRHWSSRMKSLLSPCIILHPHPDTLDDLEDSCTERKNNIVLNPVGITVLCRYDAYNNTKTNNVFSYSIKIGGLHYAVKSFI